MRVFMMVAGKVSSVSASGVVDFVCGTLQVKLFTMDLSSGSSCCIQFGSLLLSPCDSVLGRIGGC